MTDTQLATRLSFTRAGMAYLNSNAHKAGLRKALAAAEVFELPSASGSKDDALQAALRAYPEWIFEGHDLRLRGAVLAAAEAWTGVES